MRTQYIRDDVLVRPFEVPATNFLSSRYYNGRSIVDLLDSAETAQLWMDVLRAEVDFPRVPFLPSDSQLAYLRDLRATIESVYCRTVDGSAPAAAADLESLLSGLAIAPGAVVRDGRLDAVWTTTPEDPFRELVAQIGLTALTAVSGHAATLLSKCPAPRCVLYFTRHNARQHWCSDVCGNRARVARASRSAGATSSPTAQRRPDSR
ncbi:CGNR zinc finger domain-containing protein [Dietzia maris]|uniref:CGNR zinc finger domain-containing protein n=1 Tax=Dietzia maris TaxID=37915 RepID=UPI0037CABE48